jgi:acetylcholinesterase
MSGNGLSSEAGGEYLLDRDVVLVTFNYRLGSLGFLSTGTADAPGNNGFKDQVIALRWIRDHIQDFGGDPKSITLMGQGAGARSVMLHLASPMSAGLISNAIIMSGAVTGQWVVPPHQLTLAKKQAELVHCEVDDIAAMMACMRRVGVRKIGRTFDEFYEFEDNPVMVWYPVVEPDFGQERFLTEDPTATFARGNFSTVPIVVGVTSNEFAEKVPEIIEDDDDLKTFNEDFERVGPICFMYERDSVKSRRISRFLWTSYIVAPEVTATSSFSAIENLFSDGVTGFAVNRFVQLAHKFAPVYYYLNSYVGQEGNFFYPENAKKPYGELASFR